MFRKKCHQELEEVSAIIQSTKTPGHTKNTCCQYRKENLKPKDTNSRGTSGKMLHLISYQNSTARATRRCHSSPTRPEVGSQVQALGPTHGRPHTAATPRSHACPSTWGTWVARTAGSPPDAHPAHSEQSVTCPHVDHHLAVRLSEFIAKFNNMDGTQGQKG